MAWKASWAHRTGENEGKKDNDKIKKIGQTSSACAVNAHLISGPRLSTRIREPHKTISFS